MADAEDSHPGLGQESRYAEAVIAYNRKQTQKTLEILDGLIKESPKNIEYLELKALTLKGTDQPEKSFEVYKRLYQVSQPKDRGPYAFELASVLDKEGRHEEAKKLFQKSIDLGFNVGAANLYLGLTNYNTNNFSDAERNFTVAANSGIQDIELIARYYLGITYFKLNNGPQAIQELVDVQRITKRRGKNDLSKNIADATTKMLEPFSLGQWFGNVALLTQYDSNVQQLPSGVTNQVAGSNPSTMKMNFSGGGGYMSAPLDTIQWVAGYRATYNYNFNQGTKGFQYFTNNASLYFNYMTLARTSGGLKFESNFTFQNSLVDSLNTNSGYQYQKYSFNGGGGAYFRHQLDRTWRLESEANLRSQTFYIDPNLSGTDYNLRVTVRNDATNRFLNPGFTATYETNATNGIEFYYGAWGLGISNAMNVGSQIVITQSIDYLSSNYSKSTLARKDKNYSFHIGMSKILSLKLSLLADLSYIKNSSTVDASYTYDRLMTSVGLGYTL
ncbi:MAG: hypothetical protein JST80_01770 [Bdellovibrionales bacterium]|nr:hypothetical protein [Bdellovibrionales bacterium]